MAESKMDSKEVTKKIAPDTFLFWLRVPVIDIRKPWR